MKFTILILAYNYQEYVEECIRSCLNQEYDKDYQIVLVDDGSNDNTLQIARKYDDKIDVFTISNSGCEAAANFGIKQSRGEFIVRVDADDKMNIEALACMDKIISDDEMTFYYSDYEVISEDSDHVGDVDLPDFTIDEIIQRGDFLATGTFYRKSDIENLGCYNIAQKNCGLENYELILKMIKNGYTGIRVKNKLFSYRKHSNNLSFTKRNEINQYGEKLLRSYGNLQYQYNQYHPYLGKI